MIRRKTNKYGKWNEENATTTTPTNDHTQMSQSVFFREKPVFAYFPPFFGFIYFAHILKPPTTLTLRNVPSVRTQASIQIWLFLVILKLNACIWRYSNANANMLWMFLRDFHVMGRLTQLIGNWNRWKSGRQQSSIAAEFIFILATLIDALFSWMYHRAYKCVVCMFTMNTRRNVIPWLCVIFAIFDYFISKIFALFLDMWKRIQFV